MSASPDEAGNRALDFLCRQYRESIRLVHVDSLPVPVYGFDPKGWYLFVVNGQMPSRLSAAEYVAV